MNTPDPRERNPIETVLDATARDAMAVSSVCLVGMVLVVSWQVLMRFAFASPPWWTEETAQILTIYFALLAAAYAYRYDLHIGLDFAFKRLPARARSVVAPLREALVGVFGILMAVHGVELVIATASQRMAATNISTAWTYAPLPLCGLMLTAFALEKAIRSVLGGVHRAGGDEGDDGPAVEPAAEAVSEEEA